MKTFATILKLLIVFQFVIGTFLWFVILPGKNKSYDNFLKFHITSEMDRGTCEIEGKTIRRNDEMQSPGMLNEYFNGGYCFYTESSFYYAENLNVFGKIITFHSSVVCNNYEVFSKIVIAEDKDKFIFYYTKEPQNGFTIIQNPFSKEIVFKQVLESDLKKIENKLCWFDV